MKSIRNVCFALLVASSAIAFAAVAEWVTQTIPDTKFSISTPQKLEFNGQEDETGPEWSKSAKGFTMENDDVMAGVTVFAVKEDKKADKALLEKELKDTTARILAEAPKGTKVNGPSFRTEEGRAVGEVTVTAELDGDKLTLHRILIAHGNLVYSIECLELPGSKESGKTWERIKKSAKVAKE